MELNSVPDNREFQKLSIKKLLIIFIGLLIGLIVFISAYSPFVNLKQFNIMYSDSLKYSDNEMLALKNDEYFDLKKHEAYLTSRLLAAKSDSITLSINIPDSTIFIEVQGFILHQVKMEKINVSFLLEKANRQAILQFLETPLAVQNEFATIKKEPIVYKKAPKDTIEANQQSLSVKAIVDKKVFIRFEFDKDLIIELVQFEKKAGWTYLNYKLKHKTQLMGRFISSIFKFEMPHYTPVIVIEIGKDDIKAIYRALPKNTIVSLKI